METVTVFSKDASNVELRFSSDLYVLEVKIKLEELINADPEFMPFVDSERATKKHLKLPHGGDRIELHFMTFIRLYRKFKNWAGQKWNSDKSFPKLHLDASFVEMANTAINTPTPLVNSDFKNPEFIIRRLKELGFNQHKDLFSHQMERIIELLTEGMRADCSKPGTGKSAVLLAVWLLLTERKLPLLIVCPKNALVSWREQLEEWIPGIKYLVVEGKLEKRKLVNALNEGPEVILVNYERLKKVGPTIANFYMLKKLCMGIDEAHRIKSPNSQRTNAVMSMLSVVKSNLSWVLTGTPVPNGSQDLYSLLTFFNPGRTLSSFIDPVEEFGRMMTWREAELPPMDAIEVPVSLHPEHEQIYLEVCLQTLKAIENFGAEDVMKISRCIQYVLMFLSNPQSANLHDRFPGVFRSIQDTGHGAKIDKLLEMLEELCAAGEKVVVWTNWTGNVNYLKDLLKKLGYNPAFVDGSLDSKQRQEEISKFKTDDTCKVIVANPMAASEAISLHQVCHTAIFLDLTYNFAHKFQAERRIHRLGIPAGTVTKVFYLTARCSDVIPTLDVSVLSRLEQKEAVHDSLFANPRSVLTNPVNLDVDTEDEAEKKEEPIIFGSLDADQTRLDIESAKQTMSEAADKLNDGS